jgi:hypothetical protein
LIYIKRKVQNEKLHYWHSSPNVVWVIETRILRWTKHVTHTGEMRSVYKILVRKSEGKRLHGRPICS